MILAVVALIPSSLLILRLMGRLAPADASRRARVLDAVWTVVPVAGLAVLLVLAAMA